MDYGQSDDKFFTAGVGHTPAKDNNFAPEDNLDEDNWQKSLEISAPVGVPTPDQILSNSTPSDSESTKADIKQDEALVDFSETNPTEGLSKDESMQKAHHQGIESVKSADYNPISSKASASNTRLGEINAIEHAISAPAAVEHLNYNPDNIKTTGDRLEKSSIAEIDHVISEFNQTGNVTNLYDAVRGMAEANVANSFPNKGEQ